MNHIYYSNGTDKTMTTRMDYSLNYQPSPQFNDPYYSPMSNFQEVIPSDIYYLNASSASTLLMDAHSNPLTSMSPYCKVQSPANYYQSYQSPTIENSYYDYEYSNKLTAKKNSVMLSNRQEYNYTNMLIEDNRGRAENWTYEETSQFLKTLLKHQKEFENITRNQSLWKTIVDELNTYGYKRSVEKCKNRWKVLVAKYKKCEEKIRKGYQLNQDSFCNGFEFYWDLKALLGNSYVFDRAGRVKRLKKKQKQKLSLSSHSIIHLSCYEDLNLI
ncbi:hypothetical protein K502DRAFT_359248 [Neoconidiobolus thromboides FSU 785]|nr:hypothetical protein K502DRAFT_359248 [Neoconidiobolus thromboides FSU 785]